MNQEPDLNLNADIEEVQRLRDLLEGVAGAVGEEFFRNLVRCLARAVDVKFAFVAEFLGGARARTIAFWFKDGWVENIEWDLRGTPCEDVVFGDLCHHPAAVHERFPTDRALARWSVEGYLGIPLRSASGETLGHLAVFDDRPMPPEPRRLYIFRIFAARAAAELVRLQMDKQLRESERRFRDLFEEAPIAYVHEGLDSRLLLANRTAMRILGLTPSDVPGTLGRSLVADTPEAQRRLQEAFEAIARGEDTRDVVLEMRRKDDGRPVWIQWWSRPSPGEPFTRTMFIDITERVLLEREQARLLEQNRYLEEEIRSAHAFGDIVGQSPRLLAVLEQMRRVAPTDVGVLITGETGTGKELIARALHAGSPRADFPLIKLNCAALPSSLVESELFGHERGAFSGAHARRVGRFELAHRGTLLLDEVAELPLDLQAKLLRVLQERELERVGGNETIPVDVRIIAATNRDLAAAVAQGRFRQDLFYRLAVFPLHLPALRERLDDLPLLVSTLVRKWARMLGKQVEGVTPETLVRFAAYDWPGNIRELENVIQRALILARDGVLDISPVAPVEPGSIHTSAREDAPTPRDLETVEREHIAAVLRQTRWVIDGPAGAARVLGLHPNTLRSRLKRLGIRRPSHEVS